MDMKVEADNSPQCGLFAQEASAESAEKNAGPRVDPRFVLSARRRFVRRVRIVRTLAGAVLTPGCAARASKAKGAKTSAGTSASGKKDDGVVKSGP